MKAEDQLKSSECKAKQRYATQSKRQKKQNERGEPLSETKLNQSKAKAKQKQSESKAKAKRKQSKSKSKAKQSKAKQSKAKQYHDKLNKTYEAKRIQQSE